MYRFSPKKLCMMNYCNEIRGFINYTLSNLKNINGYGIRCLYKRCKNKKFFDPNIMMHHIQKQIHEEILMLVRTRRSTLCSIKKTMIESMVDSI